MRLQLCSAWRNEIWVEGRLEFDRQRLPRQRLTVQTARFNDSLFDVGMSHYLMIMMNDNDIQRLPSLRQNVQTARLENNLFVC